MSRRDVPGYDRCCPYRTRLQTFLKQHLAKARCEMSRRDGAIVAWHESAWDSATPKEPSRRVRCDWRIQRWCLAGTVHYIEQQLEHHRTRTFQEEYLTLLKKHGAHFDEKYLWD